MKKQEPKPKPCPFCGRKPKVFETILGDYALRCTRDLHFVNVFGKTRLAAIKRWNERKEK